MKAYNKIGFHTSVGGNARGLGEWMQALDEANIPFFIKAADSTTGLYDTQQLIYARNGAVPHTLVFRRSIHNGEDYDVADYEKEPEAAAAEHWLKHKKQFPKDLDPKLVWIETINEPRKEVEWANWLGHFAYYSAQLAMADGYRFSAFGYSAGTPDEGSWETDGMLRYLELCQQYPEQASVALHEYSFEVNDIWFLRGIHIGRFEQLFHACDKHGLKRPKILITEWGWTFDDVPDVAKAMKHIAEVAEYYAQFPEILGAAIWYLGPGFGEIAHKAQKLIAPVAEFTLNTTFDVPDTPAHPVPPRQVPDVHAPSQPELKPEPVVPVAPVPDEPEPTVLVTNGRFVADITIPDDTVMQPGQNFTKTWRVQNIGQRSWGAGFNLVFVKGNPMTKLVLYQLPQAEPGEEVDISIPMTAPDVPGVYWGDWRLRDDKGELFGEVIYVRIKV